MISARTFLFACTTGSALVLAACQTTTPRTSGVETVKQPTISVQRMMQPVRFDAAGALSRDQDIALEAFFRAIGVRYGDRVSLDDPAASVENRAAVERVLKRFGLLLVPTGPSTGADTPTVIVSRAFARVDNCPDWTASPYADFEARAQSNFGCAIQTNLAAMVADPRDLEAGKAYDGPDPEVITRGIKDHQTMKASGFYKLPTTKTGNATSQQKE